MGIGLWIKALELQVGIIPKEALETFSSVLEMPWALFSCWKQTGRKKKKETMDFGHWKTGCAAPWFLREGKQIRRALWSSQLTPQGIFQAAALRGKQTAHLSHWIEEADIRVWGGLLNLLEKGCTADTNFEASYGRQNNDLQKMPTS